jgi:protein-S-isoprenylcysteine O-methyltransferase Ste14
VIKVNFWHWSYELVLILAFFVLLGTPLHHCGTVHINVGKTINQDTVLLLDPPPGLRLQPGDVLPVYRFNPYWRTEIGKVKIEELSGKEIRCSFDSSKFRWPMGRQGRVIAIYDLDHVTINIGSNVGLKVGDNLILFKDRLNVGRIQLEKVASDISLAKVVSAVPRDLLGLTASEFIIPTTAVVNAHSIFQLLDWILIVLALGLWWSLKGRWVAVVHRLGNIFVARGWRQVQRVIRPVAVALLGIPFIWIFVRFFVYAILHFLSILFLKIPGFQEQGLTQIYQVEEGVLLGAMVLGGGGYYGFLIIRNECLIPWLWRKLEYKPTSWKWGAMILNRKLIVWLLHLVIVYAFASSLHGFLLANWRELVRLGWSELHVGNLKTSQDGLAIILHVFTHLPHFNSVEDFFGFSRYVLWSVTIVGCLIGYANTVFSVLWGKHLNNLDFTVTGWMCNAVCYGPLLGVALSRVVPPLIGVEPTVTEGVWHYFVLSVELALNLFYTISIWNLGTLFGVMTDKGVRTSGLYSVVRHPGYTLEALMFMVLEVRGLTAFPNWMAACVLFMLTYYIRSERDDVFMTASNSDYRAYKQRITYKFLPGVY